MEKPIETFKAGAIQASIFMNVRKVKGKETEIPSISFQKRYKEGEEWKSTSSLNVSDIPKAILALSKAYDFLLSKTGDVEMKEDEDATEEE